MHNLFLGIIKHHFTVIFGMVDGPESVGKGKAHFYKQPDPKKYRKGCRILNVREGPSRVETLHAGCTWADLFGLAEECGASLNPIRHANTKANMAEALEDWVRAYHTELKLDADIQKRTSSEARILDVDGPIPTLEIPETPGEAGEKIMSPKLVAKICDAAQQMIMPSWFTKLPKLFATASGGSLKADQWRAIATIYAPLVLIQEWPKASVPDSEIWLHLMTDLMSAIYACSSHTVSTTSITKYREHILAYLSAVKTHFSQHQFVPNYHASLHITQLLGELGPAYGWWTFPFERLIRELQNVPNNARMGKHNHL
jgi:hypothetical protein